jgi:hypothetical protein
VTSFFCVAHSSSVGIAVRPGGRVGGVTAVARLTAVAVAGAAIVATVAAEERVAAEPFVSWPVLQAESDPAMSAASIHVRRILPGSCAPGPAPLDQRRRIRDRT